MIRAIIVDDEFLARERLRKLLAEHDDIEVVGEARNGHDGIHLVKQKKPDLLFLDIQMPDLDGFEVLKKLKQIPILVFTTAFEQYALDAFGVKAIDYLLKPFDEDRLGESLERVRSQMTLNDSAKLGEQVHQLIKTHEAKSSTYLDHFELKEKGHDIKILAEDVMLIEAQGNYAKLQTTERSYMYRISMNTLESELDPDRFIRVHRTFIVNRYWVESCKYLGNNEYQITLHGGSILTSSRSYKEAISSFSI